MNVITIEISGNVQTGKSAVLASIRDLLIKNNYCVAIPEREERHNPSSPLKTAAAHEKPGKDNTVFILNEVTE